MAGTKFVTGLLVPRTKLLAGKDTTGSEAKVKKLVRPNRPKKAASNRNIYGNMGYSPLGGDPMSPTGGRGNPLKPMGGNPLSPLPATTENPEPEKTEAAPPNTEGQEAAATPKPESSTEEAAATAENTEAEKTEEAPSEPEPNT